MGDDLSQLSVEQIRQRFGAAEVELDPQVLADLRRDPRHGVRRLYRSLQRQRERNAKVHARLEAMLALERGLWQSGVQRVAGVDEAGAGPLAGPVVAAAVVFAPDTALHGVDDSKKLDAAQRSRMAEAIRTTAIGIGVGSAEVAEIDTLNIYHASLLAMRRALEALPCEPQHVLVDARTIPGLAIPQSSFTKGDSLSFSIAAASIIAKTHRDALMQDLDRRYPAYGFAKHKGYATPDHQEAIRRHGPCDIHRTSYAFIRELCGQYSALFYELKGLLEQAQTDLDLRRFEELLGRRRRELTENERRKLSLLLSRRRTAG